jgi:hypothetical protein
LHRAENLTDQFRASLSIERRKLSNLVDDPTLLQFLATSPDDVFFNRKLFAKLLDEAQHWAAAGNLEDAFTRLEGVGIMVGSVVEALALWNARKAHMALTQRKRAGGARKRRAWAETVAARITRPNMTKGECWNSIPDHEQGCLEIESDDTDLRVWRDGDTLMCIESGNNGEASRSLKQSSFKKRYLQSGQ